MCLREARGGEKECEEYDFHSLGAQSSTNAASVSLGNMRLIPATVADLETVLRHRSAMFREMSGAYERDLPLFEEASRRYFDAALRDGSYYGTLCEIDGQTVAGGGVVVAAWPGSPMNHEPKRAWILNIYVEPQYRKRGLAQTIMQELIDWCRHNGFQSVALHSSEYGRPLYEKLGFEGTNEMRLRF
jgi:GNAT superfamily N-acetyltransferase